MPIGNWSTWAMSSGVYEVKPIGTDGKALSCMELTIRQDLKAVLLDNYLLLTRDEDNGKLVVISRVRNQCKLVTDFSRSTSTSSIWSRRTECRSADMTTSHAVGPMVPCRFSHLCETDARPPPSNHPDRLMYPFTITGGVGTRTYTLCTG